MIRAALAFAVLLVLAPLSRARAETYRVGPTRPLRQLADLPALAPGDIVELDGGATYAPGVFRDDAGSLAMPIVIRGLRDGSGARAVLQGGSNTLELGADHYLVEGLEIRGGSSRCVFVHAHDLTLRDVVIHDCANHGIEGGGGGGGDLTLDHIEVYDSGEGTQHHQIYVSSDTTLHPGSRFRMQFCYVHDGNGGNNVKSRSERAEIYYNWIEGALYHELELIGPDPDDAGVGEGDAIENSDVVGNVLVKGGGHSSGYVTRVGGDGTGQTWGRYRFVSNTILLAPDSAGVFRLFTGLDTLEAHDNVIYVNGGSSTARVVRDVEAEWLSGSRQIAGSRNWVMTGLGFVPMEWTGTLTGTDPGFEDIAAFDLRPGMGSPLLDAGGTAYVGVAGRAFPMPLAAAASVPPVRALGTEAARVAAGSAPDIGAYERGGPPPPDAGTMTMTDGGTMPGSDSGTGMDAGACVPSCGTAECGDDGCGGSCGACDTRETCVSGACECWSTALSCGGTCVDGQSDPRHCGACDRACAAAEVCELGVCGTSCTSGRVACDRACVDTQTDIAHCGGCGVTCESGERCSAGRCASTSGTVSGGCACHVTGSRAPAPVTLVMLVLAALLRRRSR